MHRACHSAVTSQSSTGVKLPTSQTEQSSVDQLSCTAVLENSSDVTNMTLWGLRFDDIIALSQKPLRNKSFLKKRKGRGFLETSGGEDFY